MSREKLLLRQWAAGLPPMDASKLLDRFFALPQVEEARAVMVFYGVGKEPDTTGLIQSLLDRGQLAVLPVCLPGGRMEARACLGPQRLVIDRYGIPEPDEGCPVIPPKDIGAVLVPHLLCDRAGYRLGRGGGYYDRWLADYGGFSAAVCPRERLMDALPTDPFDVPVRLVLTDE